MSLHKFNCPRDMAPRFCAYVVGDKLVSVHHKNIYVTYKKTVCSFRSGYQSVHSVKQFKLVTELYMCEVLG